MYLHKEVLKTHVATARQYLFSNIFYRISSLCLFPSLLGNITNLHYDKCHAFCVMRFIDSGIITSYFFRCNVLYNSH